MTRRLQFVFAALAILAGSASSAFAQTSWTGANSSNWFDPANWNAGLPNAGSFAIINTTAPNPTVIGQTGAAANDLNISPGGGPGMLTLNGNGATLLVGNSFAVGTGGFGQFNLLNGTAASSVFTVGTSIAGLGTAVVDGPTSVLNTTILDLGFSGNGTLVLRNGGTVNVAGPTFLATAVGSVGTIAIGAQPGSPAAAPGVLNAANITIGSGTGFVVFNHTGTNYQFGAAIAGGPTGVVEVRSGVTDLTATNTYSGVTNIIGGTLLVNGSIASSTNTAVNAGGTLGGAGTVGNTTILGGTLAPGNSVGTITVQGSLTFNAAATYMVEIAGANTDRTNVTGTASLGGAKVVVAPGSTPIAGQRYTILNATGGVNGTFSSLNAGNNSNFSASLSYDANNVFLSFQGTLGFGTPLNANQAAVAAAVNNAFNAGNTLPPGLAALYGQTGTALANALSQASGESTSGVQHTTFYAMDQFIGALTDPFMGTRAGGPFQNGATAFAQDETSAYAAQRKRAATDAFAAYTKAPPAQFERRWSIWAAGYGGSQSTDGNPVVGSNNVSSQVYGVAAGADYRISRDTLIGFSLGGAGTRFDFANNLGGGRSDMFQAGVYGRHTMGAAYIAAALAYGWQDVTTTRNVLTSVLRANFDANAFSGRLEGGYRIALGVSGLTPYAAGQFTSIFLPSYTEQTIAGLAGAGLAFASRDVTAPRSELGLRADTSFTSADALITLRGRAAWAHNFDPDRTIAATFQALPVAAFAVNGPAQARNAALVSAGAEARWLNGFSLAATFEGEFSSRTDSYAGKGIVRYQW